MFWHPTFADINSSGKEVQDDKSMGPNREWKQPAKTLNNKHQKKECAKKWLQQASEAHSAAAVKYTTVKDIVEKNESVKNKIITPNRKR